MMSRHFKSLCLAGLCLGLCLASRLGAVEPERPFIEVMGKGEVTAQPDRARINFGIETSAPELKRAEEENARRTQAFLNVLKKYKVPPKNFQTSLVRIQPRYEYRDNRRRLADYEAAKTISVLLDDLAGYGLILQDAVEAGIGSVQEVRFETSQEKPLEEEARKLAAQDARRKAEVIAQTLGVKLGQAFAVSENGFERPVPVTPNRLRAMVAREVPAPPDEVSPGEIKIQVALDVKFSLSPP